MPQITITPEDITNGIRCDCYWCPAALAIRHVLADGYFVELGTLRIEVWRDSSDDAVWWCSRPPALVEFVEQFDSGNTPDPITFTLDIPQRFLKEQA